MEVRITSPDQLLYQGSSDMVVLPGAAGDFGVLENHAALASSLRPGTIRIYQNSQVINTIAILSGFVQVLDNHCAVYVLI